MIEKILGDFSPWHFLFEFAIGGAIIVFAGQFLARAAKSIAEITGIGQTWIGLTVLSIVTSLPEFSANISGVAFGAPEIAAGNIFGSNVFNILVIGILDFIQGRGGITNKISIRQILPASLGIALTSIAIISILTMEYVPVNANYTGFFFSGIILLVFLGGNRMIYKIETRKTRKKNKMTESVEHPNAVKEFVIFILSATVIVLAGIWLIRVSVRFAEFPFVFGSREIVFGTTFVGTIVLSVITSLPELVVAISAYKMGATNMAVSNLFGSCSFNVFIFPVLEPIMLLKTGESIFQSVDCSLLIPAVLSVIMISIAVMGLIYRSTKSYLNLGWDSLLIFFFYFVGNYLFFMADVLAPSIP